MKNQFKKSDLILSDFHKKYDIPDEIQEIIEELREILPDSYVETTDFDEFDPQGLLNFKVRWAKNFCEQCRRHDDDCTLTITHQYRIPKSDTKISDKSDKSFDPIDIWYIQRIWHFSDAVDFLPDDWKEVKEDIINDLNE